MKKILLLIAFAALAFTGCNNNDDDNNSSTLNGRWKLIALTEGFTGVEHTFEPGTITWDFDESVKKIAVINNAPADSPSALATGTYQYDYANNSFCEDGLSILFDDYYADFGCKTIVNDTLRVSAANVDGYTHTFIR